MMIQPLRYREQTSLAFEVQCNDYESRKGIISIIRDVLIFIINKHSKNHFSAD